MVSGGHRGPPDTIVFGAKDNGIWGALFVNPTEYSLCREHYYGGHSEGPGGVLLKVWILAKKSKKVEILVNLRPILGAKAYRELDHISR